MRITCAPPSALAPWGAARAAPCSADVGQRVAFGVQQRRAERRARERGGGERRGPVALVDEHDRLRARGGASGRGRRRAPRAAASLTASAPPSRVVLRVATLTAPSAATGVQRAIVGPRRSPAGRSVLPQPATATRAARRRPATASERVGHAETLASLPEPTRGRAYRRLRAHTPRGQPRRPAIAADGLRRREDAAKCRENLRNRATAATVIALC